MPAFSDKRLALLESACDSLRDRAIKQHLGPEISKDEIYEMLVRPEHLEALNIADEIAGPLQAHGVISTKMPVLFCANKTVTVNMGFMEPLKRLVPIYTRGGFHAIAADSEQMEAITDWLARAMDIYRSFALAKYALKDLNRLLKNPSQVAFYFHGVIALMRQDEQLRAVAAKLRDDRVPGSLPSLSRELRDAAITATQTIARSLLLSTDAPAPREVMFSVDKLSAGVIEVPWKPDTKIYL